MTTTWRPAGADDVGKLARFTDRDGDDWCYGKLVGIDSSKGTCSCVSQDGDEPEEFFGCEVPESDTAHNHEAETSPPITWYFLRSIGFRFTSHGVDNVPHMVLIVDQRKEVAIEVSPSGGVAGGWTVWVRSDISFARCRFCFLRNVSSERQIVRLIEAISDGPVFPQEFDRQGFETSLVEEQADARRRYKEYANGNRYGSVPGGQ